MEVFTLNLTNENVTLTAYIPRQSPEMPNMAKRRAVLVIPGGAYKFCSDREGEPIALSFLAKGYAAFVLRYSLNEASAFPKPLNDAEEALELIRKNADEWFVDPDKISAIGFSAGGHLCAALSTMGRVRPNAQILGYPCILDTIGDILANPIPSLEKEVDELTPPAFIFSSSEDGCVPIMNSIEYSAALNKQGIPFEMHIYQKGYHGFSTAEKTVFARKEDYEYNSHCATWFDMCVTWLDKLFD